MNVNLWLKKARKLMTPLDVELLMLLVLGKEDRSDLVLCGERELSEDEMDMLLRLMALRQSHVPMAYLTGKKEFYGREFVVNTDVLVPRPETEVLIELVMSVYQEGMQIVDVGCGSGCVGITLALLTNAEVLCIDISEQALDVAKENAERLDADRVSFLQSDLLSDYAGEAEIVVANLPYVDRQWEWTSPEIQFEPEIALFAEDEGLREIYRLIDMSASDYLCLEAEPVQHERIIEYAEERGYIIREVRGYGLLFVRE